VIEVLVAAAWKLAALAQTASGAGVGAEAGLEPQGGVAGTAFATDPGFAMLPPAVILLVTALGIAITRRGLLRDVFALLGPVLTIVAIWQVPDGVASTLRFLEQVIEPVEGSPERRLFATTFTVMLGTGALFGLRHASWQELAAAFCYAAGAVGVCFSGDLITLFGFWELMAVFSTLVVWCGGPEARGAGTRYAIVHFLGGVLLMAGIAARFVQHATIDVVPMRAEDLGSWLMFAGVLLNAAAVPISAWLADAYPRASATGSVFLSAFTTKTAVLTLILMFPGESLLVWIGLAMAYYGIVWALLENDARRILSYSIVNQVGFMVTAIGIGTETALNGACAHAVAHIFYKGLLFMSAGAVLVRTGRTRCTDLGGLFRTMPWTAGCAIVGALAISSFPLTSGFTTKTLISVAAAEEHLEIPYLLLAAASAGVFLHAGIKFPWFVFFQKDSGLRPAEAPPTMLAGMGILVAFCIGLGVFPAPLYALLPYEADYHPYAPGKVVHYLQLLLFAGLAFFVLLPLMKRTVTISLDVDWLWRRALPVAWEFTARIVRGTRANVGSVVHAAAASSGVTAQRLLGERGSLGGIWPISVMVTWVVALLTVYVLVYYGFGLD
jgi:multicomponent Na+:H+ antiporter subunit D